MVARESEKTNSAFSARLDKSFERAALSEDFFEVS